MALSEPKGSAPRGIAGQAVVANHLTKKYGKLEAVKDIALEVRVGEIFGIIGPDGAGKTSTFHMLSGVMQPTAGDIAIFGRPTHEARSEIGYLTQAFSMYPDLSVWENLRYFGDMRQLTEDEIRARSVRYLEQFDMARFMDRLAGHLSGGMKQKLALACALVAEPRLLLLDEPTTGVDPVSRREFWDVLAHLSHQDITIIVATPYLDEAERCHRVALMYDGHLRDAAPPAERKRQLGLHRLEVHASDLFRAESVLAGKPGLQDVQRFGDRLDVMVADAGAGEEAVRRALAEASLSLEQVRAVEPTLENVFVSLLRSMGSRRAEVDPLPPTWQSARMPRDAVAIGASRLTRRFGDFVAVHQLDLDIRGGEIYGLLGANGAGKTTAIKMLCGLLEPSEGSVTLAGAAGALARSAAVRQRVGYMSQKFSLYDDLTIEENLDFFAGVYGVPQAQRTEKARRVLEFADLTGRGNLLTRSLPGGWKQRVAFGAAIMHEPDVVFLDEPTSGVDPIARRAFWRVINGLADRGVAVLVTTHYLEEAEQCNRLGLMVAGEVVAQGSPSVLKAAERGHMLSFSTSAPQAAADLLRGHMERRRVSLFGDRLHVAVDGDPAAGLQRMRDLLSAGGISVLSAEEVPFSLEDIFIAVVERERARGRVMDDI